MSDENPFKSNEPSRWPLYLGVGVAIALVVGGTVALSNVEGPKDFGPPSLIADLAETDWSFPREGDHLRFSNLLDENRSVSMAAIGKDGRIAIALRGHPAEVLLWRDKQLQRYRIDAEREVTALAIDPELFVYVGTQGGGMAMIDPDGTAHLFEERVAAGNSVIGFAFDKETPQSSVMVAGGEVFTAHRPFEPDMLDVQNMPEARIRVMGFDHESKLVVAGDGGAAYAQHSGGWESRPISTNREAVAMGHDGHGKLLLAQDTGFIFREDGSLWEALGRVTTRPVALGEHPEVGIVVVGTNGSIWARHPDEEDFGQVDSLVSEVTPGQVGVTSAATYGHNIFVVSEAQLIGTDLHPDRVVWKHHDIESKPRGCAAQTFRSSGLPPLVRCGESLYAVSGDGVSRAREPEGFRLSQVSDYASRRQRTSRWRSADEVWIAVADFRPDYRGESVLRRVRRGEPPVDVASWSGEEGWVKSFDVDEDDLWVALTSGAVLHGDPAADPVELTAVAQLADFDGRVPMQLYDVDLFAAPGGAFVVHASPQRRFGTFVSDEGELGVTLPLHIGSVFVRTAERVLVISNEGVFELDGDGLSPRALEGLSLDPNTTRYEDHWIQTLGDTYAFRYGRQVWRCVDTRCQSWELEVLSVAVGVQPDRSLITVDRGGSLGWIAPPSAP